MKKRIVAGNWKMHKTSREAEDLVKEVLEKLDTVDLKKHNNHVVFAPPFVYLQNLGKLLQGMTNISLAAQNCHSEPKGAFTGETAVQMLKDVGCEYVIVGHSERRSYFKESDAFLKQKTDAVLAAGLTPIFCCGEMLNDRKNGTQQSVIREQLEQSLFHLEKAEMQRVVIAYEPVWAIGTGMTASPEQAQEMHTFIRNTIEEVYDHNTAHHLTILYGGSCNAQNAASLFSNADVDGGLIGGASLVADSFVEIIKANSAQ